MSDPGGVAWDGLVGHRWWRYRACAPAAVDPGVCAVDEATPTTVFEAPDSDIPEAHHVRTAREAAAVAVCRQCPILRECRAYALGPEGADRPREMTGVWGGLTGVQRRRMRGRRTAAQAQVPVVECTGARLAVLEALAEHRGAVAVARAAGMEESTANWHRSKLVTMLGLDPVSASRGQLLAAAVERGLISAAVVVPDGPVPQRAIPTQRHALPGQLAFSLDLTTAAPIADPAVAA